MWSLWDQVNCLIYGILRTLPDWSVLQNWCHPTKHIDKFRTFCKSTWFITLLHRQLSFFVYQYTSLDLLLDKDTSWLYFCTLFSPNSQRYTPNNPATQVQTSWYFSLKSCSSCCSRLLFDSSSSWRSCISFNRALRSDTGLHMLNQPKKSNVVL